MFRLPRFSHGHKIFMEICAWDEFREEILTSWDVNNHNKVEDLSIFFTCFLLIGESWQTNHTHESCLKTRPAKKRITQHRVYQCMAIVLIYSLFYTISSTASGRFTLQGQCRYCPSILVIQNVTGEDSGNYSCSARDNPGQHVFLVTVRVNSTSSGRLTKNLNRPI